jgi:hypothetical protein
MLCARNITSTTTESFLGLFCGTALGRTFVSGRSFTKTDLRFAAIVWRHRTDARVGKQAVTALPQS